MCVLNVHSYLASQLVLNRAKEDKKTKGKCKEKKVLKLDVLNHSLDYAWMVLGIVLSFCRLTIKV